MKKVGKIQPSSGLKDFYVDQVLLPQDLMSLAITDSTGELLALHWALKFDACSCLHSSTWMGSASPCVVGRGDGRRGSRCLVLEIS